MNQFDQAIQQATSGIADVILFLASEASRAINGAALPLFGKG